MDREKCISDLARLYAPFIGQSYASLSDDQKRILYAVLLWKDGADIEQIVPELISKAVEKTLTPEWVDEQIHNTFEYTDDTLVPEW